MQTPPIDTAFKTALFPTGERQPLAFIAGQRLIAQVTAAFPEEKLLHLSVQGNRLRAHTTLSLAPGRIVELEVIRGGPLPVLKLPSLTPADVVSAAMKQALPIHQNPKDFYEGLLKALPPGGQASLPQHLLARAQALVKNLPTLSTLTDPSGLAKAASQSGLFLEAKLALLGGEALEGDLKAGLLRFLNAEEGRRFSRGTESSEQETAFRSEAEALRGKAEGSIAKLLLDQLSSLPKQNAEENAWHLDLPFIHEGMAHSLRLVIEQERVKGSVKKQGLWSVMLEFNLDEMGIIRCKLTGSDENVSAHFRCEEARTTELIGGHLDALRQRFRQAGIIPGSMNASTGTQPLPALPLLSANLVDERI